MFNRNYRILFIDYLVMLTGFYLVISVFHGYITTELGFSPETAGMVLGVFPFAAMIMRPFTGFLSERLDHTLLLRVSVVCLIITGLIYWFSPIASLIVAARIVNGAAFALAGTVMIVEVYRSIPKEQAGSAIGVFGLTNVIGASIGPFLGTRLLSLFGYTGVFAGSVLLYLIMLICVPGFDTIETAPGAGISLQSFFAPRVWHFALTGAMFAFVSAILSSYIVSMGREMDGSDLSLFFSINAIAVFLIRLVGGKLYDKKGILVAGPPTMLVTAAALIIMGYSTNLCPQDPKIPVFISGALMAVGQGIAWPALQTISLQSVSKEKSGAASGTYSLGADVGQMMGPVFAGLVLGGSAGIKGYLNLFVYTGILVAIAALEFTIYMLIRNKRNVKETGNE